MRHPVDKDAVAAELAPMRHSSTKRVVRARRCRRVLTATSGRQETRDRHSCRPPAAHWPARLRRAVAADHLLQEVDLEDDETQGLVVITARPSYARIKTALEAIAEHPDLELQLVVAASALLDRYGNAVRVIVEDGFEVAARVYMVLEGENLATMAKTTGLGLLELATVFDNLKPDVVVTIADRYETLATAVAAAYMNIPLAHMQGGEVTGSIDEKVRHAVTKLADLHLVSTERSRERVIRMGEEPAAVFVTGCPSIDLASVLLRKPPPAFDPFEKYGGVGSRWIWAAATSSSCSTRSPPSTTRRCST